MSDVTNAVYVNWLVPAGTLAALVPAPLRLQTVGQGEPFAVLSVVTFQHRHFGPRGLGPLRSLAPSPVQSNWRTYVEDPKAGRRGVMFLTTLVSNRFYTVAARLTADNVSMHRPRKSKVGPVGDEVVVELRGDGLRCPSLSAFQRETGRVGADAPVAAAWTGGFDNCQQMLGFVVPQDRAMAVRDGRIVRIELDLDIPIHSVRHLTGPVVSEEVRELVGDARPWSFWVPKVGLVYNRQRSEGGRFQPVGARG